MATKKSKTTKRPSRSKKEPAEKPIRAWHFLNSSMLLRYQDGRRAEVGKTLSYTGTLNPMTCSRGMHASEKLEDAMGFANDAGQGGDVALCLVDVWGDVDNGHDKIAGRHRKVIWARVVPRSVVQAIVKRHNIQNVSEYGDANLTVTAVGAILGRIRRNKPAVNDILQWAFQNGAPITAPLPAVTQKSVLALFTPRTVFSVKQIQDALELYEPDTVATVIGQLYMDGKLYRVSYGSHACSDGTEEYCLQAK